MAVNYAHYRRQIAQIQALAQALTHRYEYTDSHGNVHAVSQDSQGRWVANEVIGHTGLSTASAKSGGGRKSGVSVKPPAMRDEDFGYRSLIAGSGGQAIDLHDALRYTHGYIGRLHAILGVQPTGVLEDTARHYGIDLTGVRTKSSIAQRIAEHAERMAFGADARYGNNGSRKAATSATKPAADPDRAARLAQLRQDIEALQQKHAALAGHPAMGHLEKARQATEAKAKAKSAPTGRKQKSVAEAIKDDGLVPVRQVAHQFDPYAPPDPQYLRSQYGDKQLRAALRRYPVASLKESVAHHKAEAVSGRRKGETMADYKERLIDSLETWAKQQPLLPELA